MHAYLAHRFFLPLPHVSVGIKNVAATSEETKDSGLNKGNTGSQTLDYGLLPKGVDSYELHNCSIFTQNTNYL